MELGRSPRRGTRGLLPGPVLMLGCALVALSMAFSVDGNGGFWGLGPRTSLLIGASNSILGIAASLFCLWAGRWRIAAALILVLHLAIFVPLSYRCRCQTGCS
jgi:uncharacterized membrane protein